MRRFAVLTVGAVLGASIPSPARAAGDCPEGDWFCDPAPGPEALPESSPPAQPSKDEGPPSPLAEEPREAPSSLPAQGPPAKEVRIDVERVEPVKPRRHRRYREWGVNLHAGLGLMAGDNAASGAGMNGLGAALRFRPIPHIAIEGALELSWGTDYNGFERFEDAILLNAMFFANPHSAVQFYGLAGFGFGAAYIDSSSSSDSYRQLRDDRYAYVGLQAGLGLEARVTRHFAIGADLIGFVRERNDRNADENPEFIDPVTHRASNTSAGGLVRLGATFYW